MTKTELTVSVDTEALTEVMGRVVVKMPFVSTICSGARGICLQ